MRGLLELLVPAVCPLCREAPGAPLCTDCRAALPVLESPCRWCAMPHAGAGPCPACGDQGLPHIERTVVEWAYAGNLVRLIGNAKAAGRPAAVAAAAALIPWRRIDPSADTLVVPIPPSPGRRPGPHLATAAARELARRRDLRCAPLLRTTRRAGEQHRLSQAERQRNVAGLFAVGPRRGALPPVLLVDDLVTSGATAVEAARTLRAAGVPAVTLVALARTLRGG